MACTIYLRSVVLFVTAVFASARFPMVENHDEAYVPIANPMNVEDGDGDGKLKTDRSALDYFVPRSTPMSSGGGGKVKTDGEMKIGPNMAGIPVASEPWGWTDTNIENGGSGDGRRMMMTYSNVRPDSISIGLIPIGGSFQFGIGLGPIDFGFGFGWDGLTPGYVVYNQPQPYVVVSPYMEPHPSFGAPNVPVSPVAPYEPTTGSNPSLPPGLGSVWVNHHRVME